MDKSDYGNRIFSRKRPEKCDDRVDVSCVVNDSKHFDVDVSTRLSFWADTREDCFDFSFPLTFDRFLNNSCQLSFGNNSKK